MKKSIRLFITALIGFLILLTTASPLYAAYDYDADIQYIFDKGIASQENFSADAFLTKGEFVKWMLINDGFTPDSAAADVPFLDVPKSSPYSPYVKKLIDIRVVKPNKFQDKFNADKPISRYLALDLIFKLEGIPTPKLFNAEWFRENISDVDPDSYIAPYAAKAVEIGLLPRFDTKQFKPFYPLTLKHAARLLHKIAELRAGTPTEVKPAATEPTAGPTIVIQNIGKIHELTNNPKFDILLNVWDKITKEYLKKDTLDKDQLLYGAISGLAKKVNDKYTEFQEPARARILQEELNGKDLEGIGAVLYVNPEGMVEVMSPLKGTPAEAAGIQAKDIITSVDGAQTKNLTLQEVVQKIRGEKGTNVTITILRPSTNETLEFTITRATILVPAVKKELTEDKIAILTINNFNADSTPEFEAAMKESLDAGAKKFVLDLRNNPGGYLDAGVAIASHFLDKGKTAVKIAYADHTDITITDKKGALFGYDVVALVNKGSASAAEIVAGTLQDYGIAKLIGETTFGKGTVQELINYIDGSSFKVTIANWLTPNDRNITDIGLTPDIYVETPKDPAGSPDIQLNRALTELRRR